MVHIDSRHGIPAMKRRAFLSLLPIGLAGRFASGSANAAPGLEASVGSSLTAREEAELLGMANRHLRQMHEIVRRWWRHPEAQREATAFLECLAEVWCRRHGAPAGSAGTQWLALACRRPDGVTGVAWREADDAVQRLEEHANRLVPWQQKSIVSADDVDESRIPLSQRDVESAFATLLRCDAAVRG
jgi:hypothetical protein